MKNRKHINSESSKNRRAEQRREFHESKKAETARIRQENKTK